MTDSFSNQALGYIKHVLEVTGMSQTTLGKAAEIAPSTLNRPLRNPDHLFSLSLSTIGSIAVATGIDPSPFLRASPLDLMRRRAGYSMDEFAKAASFAGASSVQRYCAADYDKSFRPEMVERFSAALLGRGSPPITQVDLARLFSASVVPTVSANSGEATDLLAFLHYVRAEHGIDVPERHFEMHRALRATAASKGGGDANTSADIRMRREALRLSQAELAATAGTSQQTLDRIERGETEHSRALPVILSALSNAEASK